MTSPSFLVPRRDRYLSGGRARRSAVNYYFIPGVVLWTTYTNVLTPNEDTYSPIIVRTPIVIDQLAFEVTILAASSFMRIGLYASDQNNLPIGPPLIDSGNIDTSTTGVKTYTPGTPVFLPPGRYLMVWNATGAPTTRWFRGYPQTTGLSTSLGGNALASNYTVTRTNAAFPNPGSAWTGRNSGSGGGSYAFVMRASAVR